MTTEPRTAGFCCRAIGATRQIPAGPDTRSVISLTMPRRKPLPVHLDRAHDTVARVFYCLVPNRRPVAIAEAVEDLFEVGNAIDDHTADFRDYRTAWNRRSRQHITGVGHIHAVYRPIVVTGLLIRQVVNDRITKLNVFVRRYAVKIANKHFFAYVTPAPFKFNRDLVSHVVIEDRRQRHELRDEFAVNTKQYVARRQFAGGIRLGDDLLYR